MDYIIALIVVLLIVPLLFMLLTRRSAGVGGIDSHDRGVTPDRPSSDQPTPPADPAKQGRIPPG